MGRYRPPQPVGSKYITAEGHKRLTEELDPFEQDGLGVFFVHRGLRIRFDLWRAAPGRKHGR